MLTLSKPLSASQVCAYHSQEFTSPEQSYYSQQGQARGEWHGKLAAQWGLAGEVSEAAFARLANGQHPDTGEPLVRHREPFHYRNEQGEMIKTMEHRAGWDATFSAPKSVSLTALVGRDERVRQAHRDSVRVASGELERFVQARRGGHQPAETTGKWVAVLFEHDSARPVEGYAAPQLHTHLVLFNLTETADGKSHALQSHELYKSQQYVTAVYQAELGYRLKQLGYEIEPGKNGAPEIQGYSQPYLDVSSPRSRQIRAHLEHIGLEGAGAAQIAAHRTREAKSSLGTKEMLERHHNLAAAFGNQPEQVVRAALSRGPETDHRGEKRLPAREALTYSRDRHIEREAVVDERALLRDALRRCLGTATFGQLRENLDQRIRSGEFVGRAPDGVSRLLTTREMVDCEQDNLALLRSGQGTREPLVSNPERLELTESWSRLSARQRQAVEELFQSRDQLMGLEGTAGAGKTTALAAIREAVEQRGYAVEGLAPTSRAAQQLEGAGIASVILQHHLVRSPRSQHRQKRLYIVDESSLASSRQVNAFLHRLREQDRVLWVGDSRQHQGVEAGRPFEQLQQAGLRTARLDEIVRQKDPALKQAVEQLARGEVRQAVEHLRQQGRVHAISGRQQRFQAMAQVYAECPEQTLVVSPDHGSRQEINQFIHRELQSRGKVKLQEHALTVLVSRQDMTGADRQWASRYETGDVLRYSRGSLRLGVKAGEYVRVSGMDRENNLLRVQRADGSELDYDPVRLQGVNGYREGQLELAEGDRIQFTSPDRRQRIANRELGTVERIESQGNLELRMDSGREVKFNLRDPLHLDFGYAVTSHSSQGVTAGRVLVHVDTGLAHEKLVNSRLAYVALSRGRYDAQIYTDNAESLGPALSREVSKTSAIEDVPPLQSPRQEQPPAVVESFEPVIKTPGKALPERQKIPEYTLER
jgi:conjugative relaxase-like TrwC/TraI family protein